MNSMDIYYRKVRDVKTPQKGHTLDAGIDFFIPNEFPKTIVHFGHSVLIPLGIKVAIPENTCLMGANKSGISLKLGLIHGGNIVDAGYTGELHIQMISVVKLDTPALLLPGMKIIQYLLIKLGNTTDTNLIECDMKEYDEIVKNIKDQRGPGAFGSTGIY